VSNYVQDVQLESHAVLAPHGYERELHAAIHAVGEAARLCQVVQREILEGVLEKEDRSPVTIADYGSQALICRRLRQAFPDDPIIAEEDSAALRKPENAGLLTRIAQQVQRIDGTAKAEDILEWIDEGRTSTYSGRLWTLDPIDGTKGFLRGEQYAVALALLIEGEVRVAVLACPNLGDVEPELGKGGAVYVAIRGAGAARMRMSGGKMEAVHVSRNADPEHARFCESYDSSHSSHSEAAQIARQLGIGQPPIRVDSQVKYALVAGGVADLYLRLPSRPGYVEKIWDHAAGTLIVEEAGGRVTDASGRPLEYYHGAELRNNKGVVVTNARLHDTVMDAVRKSSGQMTISRI
jgi:3'(2'), 5'-bisphosphate nucleotidase